MLNITWKQIRTFSLPEQDILPPWVLASDDLGAAMTYLKLKAKGEWTAMAGLTECGPDGLVGQAFPDDRLLLADCPVGALIGRIGGSSATLKAQNPLVEAGESKPFPVGCYTVLKLPDKCIGPLYLGFNILLRPMKLKRLEVEIIGGA